MKKQLLKEANTCSVVFTLPAEAAQEAKEVQLVGDFNNWDVEKAIVMKRLKSGAFQVRLKLTMGQDYHFRYLLDGTHWENDWEADHYEASPLHPHIDNSVLRLTEL